MAVPSASDFNKWGGTKFDNTDWDDNVDKIVEITANGNYDLNVNQITASTYVGIPSDQFSTITAGENLTAGDVVRISGGQAYKADNTSSAGVTAVVGVCNTTVSSGATVKIDYGFYNSFSSLTAGTKYYVGTSGGLTATKPSLHIVEIGTAVSTTRININIKKIDIPVQVMVHGADNSAKGTTFVTYSWPNEIIDTHSAFSSTTFTAPHDANYMFTLNWCNDYGGSTFTEVGFDINGSTSSLEYGTRNTNTVSGILSNIFTYSVAIPLSASDTVVLRARTNSSSATIRDSISTSGVSITKQTSLTIQEIK